MLTNYNTA